MQSTPNTPRIGPQIRLKADAGEPSRSALPLPSWAALSTSKGKGKVISSEPSRGFFNTRRGSEPAPGSRRFGELVSAHLSDLDRSTWRFRWTRPFVDGGSGRRGSAHDGVLSRATRWLFMDEPGEVPSHEEDGEEMYEEPSEALLATPELNISGAFPRRGSTSVQGSTLSPVAARTRRLPSVTRRKQPIPKALSLRRQLGISRFAVALLLLLLFFGLNEVLRGGDVHRRKGRPSEPVLTTRWVHSPRTLLRTLHLPKPPSPRPLTPEQRDELNTTAIVLTYQRRSNVLVVASHLCQYTDSIFRDVLIWNNDPLRSLTIADFASTGCPMDRLRIYNSPDNTLFLARYLACAMTSTPYCYFQDDDFLVWPLRSLHAQFLREPEGPTLVAAGATDTAPLYSWTWCFFQEPLLHSCFAWLGAGSFVSRAQVLDFLDAGISGSSFARGNVAPLPRDSLSLADNFYTTLRNEPPYALQHAPITLVVDSHHGFSDGLKGETRNQRYIARGVERLLAFQEAQWRMEADVPEFQLEADHRGTPVPPSLPHPHAHHSRAPSADDSCIFITNVPSLPAPGRTPLETREAGNFSLAKWEMREQEDWAQLVKWSIDYPYFGAVDDDYSTVWRSSDVVRRGDYIGLMLVDPLEADQAVNLDIAFDEADEVLDGGLDVEISRDGYKWLNVPGVTWSCRTTPHRAHPPSSPFPASPILSPLGARLRSAETTWATQRRRRGERIRICSVSLSSSLPGRALEDSSTMTGREGWRFVRAVYEGREGAAAVGWGVYEISFSR